MTPEITALGDVALLLHWPDSPDESSIARVNRIHRALARRAPEWVQDWVPAYCSLGLILRGESGTTLAAARRWLQQTLAEIDNEDDGADSEGTRSDEDCVQIPVCYDPEFGTDLDALAQHARLSVDEVIKRHSAARYRVAMLGFSPGFPYLLGLDPTLAMPRRSTPRASLAAGSVAIAGGQAGIYPTTSPGGWQVLGRTPLRLFEPTRSPPSLLRAGDALRFTPITRAQFDAAINGSTESSSS